MMFDVEGVQSILNDTTRIHHKGGTPVLVAEDQPPFDTAILERATHVDKAEPVALVDLHYVVVAVDPQEAEHHRARLEEILAEYPEPERLAGGPSYIEVGSALGGQEDGLRLIALGSVLGMWEAITPASQGVEGDDADFAAAQGMIHMSGWKP